MRKIVVTSVFALMASMAAQSQDNPEGMFEKLDRDGNNIVTHQELMAEAKVHFSEYDTNADGLISLNELPELMPIRGPRKHRFEKIKERMEERQEVHGDDAPPRMSIEGVEKRMQPTRLKFVARMDKDHDEHLSLEEFAAPFIHRFKKADADGDGNVTLAEHEEARANARHERGDMRERGKMRRAFR